MTTWAMDRHECCYRRQIDLPQAGRLFEGPIAIAVTAAQGVHVREGSKPEKLNESKCFPLFTQQRTSPRYFGMSVSCQERKSAKCHFLIFVEQKERPPRGGLSESNRCSIKQLA
jgi:hypothetical protein